MTKVGKKRYPYTKKGYAAAAKAKKGNPRKKAAANIAATLLSRKKG